MMGEIFIARLIKTRAVGLGIITKPNLYIGIYICVCFNDSLQYNFNLSNLYVTVNVIMCQK